MWQWVLCYAFLADIPVEGVSEEYMDTTTAVIGRILELCREKAITVNRLSTLSALKQSTVNDIVSGKTRNPGIVTLKKLCDGLDISLTDFFTTPTFRELEQEIR